MSDAMNADRWARVKRVFHDALERGPAERRAFVAHVCADDEMLRAEVERLLAAHDEAGAFIEPPPAGMTGRRVGRYEVGRLLGAGGMGEVYVARDVELGRDVALKIGISDDAVPRLRREAQYASQLNHPHICTIHEVGAFEGRAFIAMEFVEGQRLSDLIAPEGQPIDFVVRCGIQMADALEHAHQHGVIHRDLKGENVIVTPDGRAKILDFGLARRVPAERLKVLSESQERLTASGLVAGTLSCMAPEVLRGESADARSDIWALGVLLYTMAAGARPFTGATGFELSAAILLSEPAPLPPRVPAVLQQIIRHCLEKNPGDRYQHAAEIRSALEAMRAESTAFRVPLRFPSQRIVLALLGVLLAIAGVAVAWRSWSASGVPAAVESTARPAIAVLAFDNLAVDRDTSWLSKGVQSMLLTGLAQGRGLTIVSTQRLHEVVRETGGPSLESLDRAQVSDVARRAGASVAVVGSIAKAGSAIRIDAQINDLSSGRVVGATSVSGTDLFALVDQLAARIRESVGDRDAGDVRPVVEVSTASLEAYRMYSQGMDAFANMRLDEARDLLEQAVATDPTFAEAYLQLALLSGPAGRPGDRSGYLRKAAEHGRRLSERRRLLMDVEVARDEGRFTDAARGLERLSARFPDLDAISTLAMQLHAPVVGPLPDAEKLLAIASGVVAANPSSTLARNVHGYALVFADRFDDAIREFEIYARLAPREPNPYDSLGEAYLLMGLPDKALESYSRALAIDPAFSTGGRAWVLAVLGRYDEALSQQGSPPYLRAIMLARLGRHREAREAIVAAARTAEAGGNLAALGGLHILASLLAVERKDYARALDETRAAERILATLPRERNRFSLAVLELIGGVAELRSGRPDAARARLESERRLYEVSVTTDQWWRRMLEGEIALAAGDLDGATSGFSQGAPSRRHFSVRLIEGSVLANDLVFRDGLARTAKARGDLRAAVDLYRRLLTYGPEQKWVASFEPRYVLEIARLLEQSGDKQAARAEYERFLQLWKHADADLPEPFEARRALVRLGRPSADRN